MNEEILKVLNEYNNHRHYADYSFIDRICSIIINDNSLNKYVKRIYTTDKKYDMNSHYSYANNYLYFNLAKTYDSFIRHFDPDNYYYYYNLCVLTAIFHEITHVEQEKIKNSDGNFLLKNILILSDPITYLPLDLDNKSFKERLLLEYKWKKYRHFYKIHYLKAPEERMAIINSYLYTKEVIHLLDLDINYIDCYNSFLNLRLSDILTYGYHLLKNQTNSPTIDYLKKMPDNDNHIILKNKAFLTDKTSYDERLFMGLTLTKEEYCKLKNGKTKIKKM